MKTTLTITLNNEIIEWLREEKENISGFINDMLLKEYQKEHHLTLESIEDKVNELNQQLIFHEIKRGQLISQLELEKQLRTEEETDNIERIKQEKLERTKLLVVMAKQSIPEIQEIYKEFKDKDIQITDTKWFLSKVDHIKSLHSDIKLGIVQLREIMLNLD